MERQRPNPVNTPGEGGDPRMGARCVTRNRSEPSFRTSMSFQSESENAATYAHGEMYEQRHEYTAAHTPAHPTPQRPVAHVPQLQQKTGLLQRGRQKIESLATTMRGHGGGGGAAVGDKCGGGGAAMGRSVGNGLQQSHMQHQDGSFEGGRGSWVGGGGGEMSHDYSLASSVNSTYSHTQDPSSRRGSFSLLFCVPPSSPPPSPLSLLVSLFLSLFLCLFPSVFVHVCIRMERLICRHVFVCVCRGRERERERERDRIFRLTGR